jgi:acyl carrier protein
MSSARSEVAAALAPTREAVLAWLARALEQEFEIPAHDVRPEAHLVDDLDLDSIDGVALIVRLEEDTGLRVEREALLACRTVLDLVELVRGRLAERDE